MIVHDVEQGSEEWLALRLGIPTTSQFGKILTPKTLNLSAQADAYIDRLVAEWALWQDLGDIKGPWLDRGTEMEPEARRWYAWETETTVTTPGFITTDDGRAGCSPDGIVDGVGGLEIKVRNAANHVAMLRKGITTEVAQVQGSMWVTGFEWWDVVAYNPFLPSERTRILRDTEYMDALDEAIPAFLAKLDDAKAEIVERYNFTPADKDTAERRIRALLDAGRIAQDDADELRYVIARGNGLWVHQALTNMEAVA